jgi:uncharacterized membrane protein YgcG
MEMLDRYFGAPPFIQNGVNDLAGMLSKTEVKGLKDALARFVMRLPQTKAVLVTCQTPQGVPLSGYTFWLFNRSQVGSAMESGGGNRMVMVTLDAASGAAACMIGYGLEPFFPETVIQDALKAARGHLAAAAWVNAVTKLLSVLEEHAIQVCTETPEAYGWKGEVVDSWEAAAAAPERALNY